MFGTLGMPELLFILVLALLVFGPKRLPQVGKTLGKGLREFRRATNELRRTVDTEISAPDSASTEPTRETEVAAETESPVESETTKKAAPVAAAAATADNGAETQESADAE